VTPTAVFIELVAPNGAKVAGAVGSGTATALIFGGLVLAVFVFAYASARPGKEEVARRQLERERRQHQMWQRSLEIPPGDIAAAKRAIRRALAVSYCAYGGMVVSAALATALGAHGFVVLSWLALAVFACFVLWSWYSVYVVNARPCPCCGKSFLIKVARLGFPDIASGCQHGGFRFPI
jgi:hypothetical protein